MALPGRCLRDMIHYECPVSEITTGDNSVTVAYDKGGTPQTITADYCICTMPLAVLATTKNNFSAEARQAITGMQMFAAYKIAWESPRFWEKENHIYGGISFLKERRRPGLVSQRKTLFSHRGADFRLRL